MITAVVFSAVTQSPITAFVIFMEMTNGSGMVILMMATAVVASRISVALPEGDFLQKKPVPPPGA